jgi:hypothetical protein
MRHGLHRLAATAACAALVLLAVAPAGLPTSDRALAADRGLVIIVQTRYDAIPDQARIHVTLDAVATSYTPNSGNTIYYYNSALFTVQPGIAHLAASSGSIGLRATVAKAASDHTEIKVSFSSGVFYRQSYTFRVTFDLPDPGGVANRDLRIGKSIVAFPVWAFGSESEPGSTVRVFLPNGFTPSVQGDSMSTSTGANGEVVLSALTIPDPAVFFAYVSADRPGAFVTSTFTVPVAGASASVAVEAWDDDAAWGTRMKTLMTDGLPTLADLIGLPWPVAGDLKVEEAATSRLGAYAGTYDNITQTIRVRYDADGVVALHEGAHIWFNRDLFPDVWLLEAWAEFYGVQAASSVGASGTGYELTADLLRHKIPLNDWAGIVSPGPPNDYAYAASYHLATVIFARTDLAGLRSVWKAAKNGEMAYQAANAGGQPQAAGVVAANGWETVLDLLEQRTGANYDDLWSAWVVNADQAKLMTARAGARTQYLAVEKDAGTWDLPIGLRFEMGAWQFDAATKDLDAASLVLDERDQIATSSTKLDLTPPSALKGAFEGDAGLDKAKAEADSELAFLAAIKAAKDRLATPESAFELIGLIGADPGHELDAARIAFEAGRIQDGSLAADRAVSARDAAEGAGKVRAAIGGGGLVILAGSGFASTRVRRRRRARLPTGGAEPMAEPIDSPAAAAAPPDDPAPESPDPSSDEESQP